jgi:hypothetical protein
MFHLTRSTSFTEVMQVSLVQPRELEELMRLPWIRRMVRAELQAILVMLTLTKKSVPGEPPET